MSRSNSDAAFSCTWPRSPNRPRVSVHRSAAARRATYGCVASLKELHNHSRTHTSLRSQALVASANTRAPTQSHMLPHLLDTLRGLAAPGVYVGPRPATGGESDMPPSVGSHTGANSNTTCRITSMHGGGQHARMDDMTDSRVT